MRTSLLSLHEWIRSHKRQLWIYGLPSFIALHTIWHGKWSQTLLALGFMGIARAMPLLEGFRQRGEQILGVKNKKEG